MAEELPLAGGNVGGAVRVGDTVRRPVGPWTPAVHALLRHLDDAGFPEAPRALGIDDRGREILSFLDGETAGDAQPWPAWTRAAEAVAQIGELLRRYHEVVASFRPPDGAMWRFTSRSTEPGEVICHNDAAPYNVVWRDGRISGLFDWDVAGPGHPLQDLAFAAWQWVPLHDPSLLDPGWEQPPDTGGRLQLLCDAYGLPVGERSAFVDMIPERMRASVERIAAGADAGDPGMRALRDRGYLNDMRRSLAHVQATIPSLRHGAGAG
jgi:hypothetical protein